eukprot:9477271-Pyramimonas_sp.AAC.1
MDVTSETGVSAAVDIEILVDLDSDDALACVSQERCEARPAPRERRQSQGVNVPGRCNFITLVFGLVFAGVLQLSRQALAR